MCLVLRLNEDGTVPPPLVATENMLCYKILKDRGFSIGRGYKYRKGTTQSSINLVPTPGHYLQTTQYVMVERGYHSYTPMWALPYRRLNLFVIPKGASYYTGGDNRAYPLDEVYVSSTIIYVGKNNWWNRFCAKLFYGVTFKAQ